MQTSTAHVLQGTPVWTRLGEHVGRVHDLEFDIDTGKLIALHVHYGHWVPLAGTKTLIVAWTQIVEITPEKVVVEDATIKERKTATEPLGVPVAPTPAV
jgi:sporulation protein YlmC with PRC-barrel domain